MTLLRQSGSPPIVCGHRGAAAVEPENTLASFGAAAARGATWVEFDVRPCADGTLVVHHDPDTADGRHVASTVHAELGSSIPTFAQLVEHCRLGLDIELKTDDVDMSQQAYVELASREIRTHCADYPAPVIVTSFDSAVLAMFQRTNPTATTGLLFHDREPRWAIETALADGHAAIAPWFRLVETDLVDSAHRHGLSVLTWTVNDPSEIVRVAEAGVDMIIGDDPAVIIEALEQAQTGS